MRALHIHPQEKQAGAMRVDRWVPQECFWNGRGWGRARAFVLYIVNPAALWVSLLGIVTHDTICVHSKAHLVAVIL